MGLGLHEATARVTAPGQLFEVVERRRGEVSQRAFTNAPRSLRDVAAGARGANGTFLVYEGEEWSFDDVMRGADEFADALVQHFGVRRGDRVAIAMRNLPEWVVAFVATVSIGGVAVPLNAWWTSHEMDFALGDAEPTVVVCDPERCERVLEICRRREVPVVLARGDVTLAAPAGVLHWVDVVRRGARMPEVKVGPDDDATILYTSGTSGQPKGAVSTHDAICQTLMAFSTGLIVEGERRGPRDHPAGYPTCFILIVPLFHVTGCIPVMLSCLAWQFTLVMVHHWDPEVALALIERHRVTNVVGVPTQALDLVAVADHGRFDTASLVTVGGGGAPAPASLVGRVERVFDNARPNLGFGMTETNAYGPQIYGDDYLERPTSTGQTPTCVMDVEIRDDRGAVLGPDEVGEVWVSGPTLLRGYWRQPEATSAALVDGWLRTGDLGRLDGEGFLYIEDRAKDMILRGGENVYCVEVESVIYEHPAVLETAVCGLPDARLGECVAAVVVLRDEASLDEIALRDFVAERLARYKVPTRIALTTTRLPRGATGKVSKSALAELYFRSAP